MIVVEQKTLLQNDAQLTIDPGGDQVFFNASSLRGADRQDVVRMVHQQKPVGLKMHHAACTSPVLRKVP